MSTDKEWEKWGKNDPYFGVLTHNKFRTKNLDPAAKAEFFELGNSDISHVVATIKQHIKPSFSPLKALDYGCGTGRLVIPLSRIATSVVGVDISDSMLREAQANCNERSIKNVSFVKADDALSNLDGTFDFIHSYIVLQHIATSRGKKIVRGLLNRLEENGVGALQITYAHSTYEKTGRPAFGMLKYVVRKIIKKIPLLTKDPDIEMNRYDLNELFFILQKEGIVNFYTEFTDHGGDLGVYLYFCKPGKKG